jgi:hypothetical protein
MLMLLALVAATSLSADQRLSAMSTLYEQVCLEAFPNDIAVETLMKAQNARELSPDEVKVTMGDDPARGWELKGGGATVWVEFPPFHACSVRWNTTQVSSLGEYRGIADRYESTRSRFEPMETADIDRGDIHIHAVGERRTLPSEAVESLLVIDQRIIDPKRREAGETGVVLRLVHQFTQPPSSGASAPPVNSAALYSSPQDRERFVAIAHQMEAAPLDRSAQNEREWAMKWIAEAPDVKVTLCPAALGDFFKPKTKYKYGGEIAFVLSFSSAAFVIEHPGRETDYQAQFVAGVAGALKAYRAILTTDPGARSKALDSLLDLQTTGDLQKFIGESSKGCVEAA